MNRFISLFVLVIASVGLSSCTSKQDDSVTNIDTIGKIYYLKTRCKDDDQLLARLLDIRYTQLDSILTQKTELSAQTEERVEEVFSFATSGKTSLTKIRVKYDTGMKWYDYILYLPVTHSGWFWGVTLFLLLFFILNRLDAATDAVVTSPHTLSGIGGFLAKVFFFIKNGFAIEVLLYVIVVVLHFVL